MSIADDCVSVIEEIAVAQGLLASHLARVAADGSKLDSSAEIPGGSQTVSELDSEINTVCQSIKGIAEQADLTLIPLKQLNSALTALQQIAKSFGSANAVFAAAGPLQSADPKTFEFTGSDDARRTISRELNDASEAIEELLADWHLLRLAAKSPRINDFASFLRINEKQREALEHDSATIQRLKHSAESSSQSIAELETKALADQNEIERLKGVVHADRKTANEYLAEVTTKLEGIRRSAIDAQSLAEEVREYSSEFERFKSQLDERTKKFNDGATELTQLIERLNQREKTIDHLIQQSEGMLVGATNAGLAGSLSARLSAISTEVTRARITYYFSIFLLACATIPIAFDVLPKELLSPILKKITGGYLDIGNTLDKSSSDLIGHVLARALLLVPALLLVRFAAARHERLFRLREHYAYKYSIASSVEGFKQQSPDQYRDYVALIAFNELTFNPATQMEAKGQETKHLNPILDAAMRKLGLAPEHQEQA